MKSLSILLLILTCANSTVFLLGRTLIPLAPSYSLLSEKPYGYKGPIPKSAITLDKWGSFNGSYCYEAYTVWSLKKGIFPFWNPYQGLGQPYLANGLSAVLYPPTLLALIIPPAWWDMIWLLNWLLAAFFLYLYLRLLGIEPIIALVGGAAVLSTGFFQIYLALREVVAVAAWWPLLLYGVERTVRNPSWPHRHWVLALAVYCSITAGQLESTFVSLFIVLLYAIIRLIQIRELRVKTFLALIPGTLGGLLLAAPMWVNFAAYALPAYSRHLAGSKVGLDHYLYNATSGFFFPGIYGTIYSGPFGKFTGWDWDWSPGWAPALLVFLAFISLESLRRHRGPGQLFFTILTLVTLAKFCGMPGINWLGSLPIFERIYFVRYAAFLLTFGLIGMAVYGLSNLVRLELRQWQNWLVGWSFFCLGVLILGIYPIWGHFQRPWSAAFLAIFGGLGLAWAVLPPLALFWLRLKRPDESTLFYIVAALGILWQGIAHAPDGFTGTIKGVISFGYLVIFLLTVLLISRYRIFINFKKLAIYGLIIAALPKILLSLLSSQGLPKRYDAFTPPPYLSQLAKFQDNGIFRSYSFDSAPAPNFTSPFGLSSLAILDPILPKGNGHFVQQYIDRGTLPLLLGGNKLRLSIDDYDPVAELGHNLRYYSLVSVKFILGQETEPKRFNSAGTPEEFPLIYEDTDSKVKIWENTGSAPRLFLAPESGVASSWEDALGRLKNTPNLTRRVWLVEGPALPSTWPPDAPTGKILSFHIAPNDIRATFEAYTPGILTLTDSYSPGWQAFLNDQEVSTLLVDGVFRGVRLDKSGTYKLHYHYRPPYWYLSLALATFGLLLVIGGIILNYSEFGWFKRREGCS